MSGAIPGTLKVPQESVSIGAMVSFICSRPLQRTAEEELQDSVFSQAFIPKTLEEVDDHERDFDRLAEGGGTAEGIYYQVGCSAAQRQWGLSLGPVWHPLAARRPRLTEARCVHCRQGITGMRADMTGARGAPAFMGGNKRSAAAAADMSAIAAVPRHAGQPAGPAQIDVDGRCSACIEMIICPEYLQVLLCLQSRWHALYMQPAH
jgi:hypothetical protein